MRLVKAALLLVFLVVGWLIGWSNNDPVSFSFIDWQLPELPVFILYSVFLTLGIFIGLILGRLSSKR